MLTPVWMCLLLQAYIRFLMISIGIQFTSLKQTIIGSCRCSPSLTYATSSDGHTLRSWPRTTVHLPFLPRQRTAHTDVLYATSSDWSSIPLSSTHRTRTLILRGKARRLGTISTYLTGMLPAVSTCTSTASRALLLPGKAKKQGTTRRTN